MTNTRKPGAKAPAKAPAKAAAEIDRAVYGARAAAFLLNDKQGEELRVKAKEGMVNMAKELFAMKIKLGSYKADPLVAAFVDTLVSGGMGRRVADNYAVTLRKTATTGKFSGWNSSPAREAKAKGKAKGVTATADVIFRAYRHDGFAGFCQDVQKMYDDDKAPSLFACVEAWLRLKGKTLPEAKTK